ncbi:MAG: hypothetical protein HDT37_07460 [Clostridiales bacterium]|nr:hypothetical protein [Clostridiales bacterium]
MKKRTPRLIALALLCLIAISAYVYCSYVRVQNVFDQMYFSRTQFNSWFGGFTNSRYLFEDVLQIKNPSKDTVNGTIEMGNKVYEHYDSKFLEDGHRIAFCFNMTSHILYIDYTVETEGGQEWYEYIYNVDQKSLTYKTSNPENIEMKQFLFDRVLPDWFAANGLKTRFSLQNLGHYTLIDTTA